MTTVAHIQPTSASAARRRLRAPTFVRHQELPILQNSGASRRASSQQLLSRRPQPLSKPARAGQGRHPLVLLQQAAVNLSFSELATGGVVGINGPPGTGKTTLLRDIVAEVVRQRADAMVHFDDPERPSARRASALRWATVRFTCTTNVGKRLQAFDGARMRRKRRPSAGQQISAMHVCTTASCRRLTEAPCGTRVPVKRPCGRAQ